MARVYTRRSGFALRQPGATGRRCPLGHVGRREARRGEHDVEGLEGSPSAQPSRPARLAGPGAAAWRGNENGAVADEVQHGVEMPGLGDPLRQVRRFHFRALGPELLDSGEALAGGDACAIHVARASVADTRREPTAPLSRTRDHCRIRGGTDPDYGSGFRTRSRMS